MMSTTAVWCCLVLLLTLPGLADSSSSKMITTSGCGISLTVGTSIMGSSAVSTNSVNVVVKKGDVAITSGSSQPNDGSVYTVETSGISSGSERVIETSGATFVSGSCSNKRVTASTATLTVPSSGEVKVWAGYADRKVAVTITPTFTFTISLTSTPTAPPTPKPSNPSPAPTPTPTSPTAQPTLLPTAKPSFTANTPTFAVSVVFTVDGSSVSALDAAESGVVRTLASKLGLEDASVVVLGVASAPTSVMAMAARRWQFQFLQTVLHHTSRLLGTNTVSITAQALGFTSQASAASASTTLQTYLVSAQFLADVNANTGLALSGAAVKSCGVVTIATSSFKHKCAFNPTLSLLWTVNTDAAGGVTAMLKTSQPNIWLSGGVTSDSSSSMIGNNVFLYAPTAPTSYLGYYSMDSKAASGFNAISSTATAAAGHSIVSVQSTSEGSSLQFVSTSAAVDPTSSTGSNFIWAHGGQWPAQHDDGNFGFTRVYWQQGTCTAAAKGMDVSPVWIFLLLGLVAVFNVVVAPHAPGLRRLAQSKPWPRLLATLPMSPLRDHSLGGIAFLALFLILMVLVLVLDSSSPTGRVTPTSLPSRSGKLAIMLLWTVILPTSKTALTPALLGVSLERAIKFHRIAAALTVASGLLHLLSNLTTNAPVFYSALPYGSSGIKPVYGLAAFVTLSAVVVSSWGPVRRLLSYEAFLLVHQLYLAVLALVIVHLAGTPSASGSGKATNLRGSDSSSSSSLLYLGLIPGLLLHALGRVSRLVAKYQPHKLLSSVRLGGGGLGGGKVEGAEKDQEEDQECVVTSLTVAAPAPYAPGQYYFLHIPGLATTTPEWHPISVSGSGSVSSQDKGKDRDKDKGNQKGNSINSNAQQTASASTTHTHTHALTFHIKSQGPGTWSGLLADKANRAASDVLSPLSHVCLHGPFGSLSIDLAAHSSYSQGGCLGLGLGLGMGASQVDGEGGLGLGSGTVLGVCGGIGITAVLPILEGLLRGEECQGRS